MCSNITIKCTKTNMQTHTHIEGLSLREISTFPLHQSLICAAPPGLPGLATAGDLLTCTFVAKLRMCVFAYVCVSESAHAARSNILRSSHMLLPSRTRAQFVSRSKAVVVQADRHGKMSESHDEDDVLWPFFFMSTNQKDRSMQPLMNVGVWKKVSQEFHSSAVQFHPVASSSLSHVVFRFVGVCSFGCVKASAHTWRILNPHSHSLKVAFIIKSFDSESRYQDDCVKRHPLTQISRVTMSYTFPSVSVSAWLHHSRVCTV